MRGRLARLAAAAARLQGARGSGARKTGGVMGLIAEHDGALDGYEAVQLPPAPAERGCRGAAMLRRRSARTSKRAVLYLHCLADSFVPEDLASWYTERGFHFYVADLRPQARLDRPAGGRRGAPDLGECFSALDAMSAYLRDTEAIDTMVVSAHAAGALIAALWCDARRDSRPADALILAGPAFGSGRRKGMFPGLLAGAQRQLRGGLDIACPVLVMCTAADWDAPESGRRRKGPKHLGGGPGTTRLGPHVTWLRLAEGLTGPLPPGGPESRPFFRELGRWLGAYLSGQFRDQLL
jgi:Serine aminopeptidase, S33